MREKTLDSHETKFGFLMITEKKAENTFFVSVNEEQTIYTVVCYLKESKEGLTETFHNRDIAMRTFHNSKRYI